MTRRSTLLIVGITTIGVLLAASPVLAHIDPDPAEAQPGSELSVGFTVQHGCEGSPTIQLDMRLPDGVSAAEPEPLEGWTGTIDANVVTFIGGPLPDDQELTFRVTMVLPSTPDTTIYFPFVQRCEVGEIRWIDIPADGSGAELDEPAPAMRLVGPVVTTTAAATTVAASATFAPATTGPSTTAAPSTTDNRATTTPAITNTLPVSDDASAKNGPAAGTAVFIAVVAVIIATGTFLALRSRRNR